MKRAVSVSLGSPVRDKAVQVNLNGVEISVERIGTGGNVEVARQLFNELDGKVDALSVGGMDLYVRVDEREYPIRSALRMVSGVSKTPLVDGRLLKYVLERRIFKMAAPLLGENPHFRSAFIPTAVDRIGLAEAVTAVSDELIIGDLMLTLGIPIPLRGIQNIKRFTRLLLPVIGYFPLSWILPPGSKDEGFQPKYHKFWQNADLIAGDLHYIRKYSPLDLSGKVVITNTTTPPDVEILRERGVHKLVTTTPVYDGRSFGINMMEAVLTAYAGLGRPLREDELGALVEELDLKPGLMMTLNP